MQCCKGWYPNDLMKKNYAVGWIALTIYAFAWLINFDVSRAAESVFILCFIIAWCKEPDPAVKFNKVFLLLIAFISLQVGVYFFAVERFPDVADEQVKAARHMTKLFLCIAVAWWLRGSINAAKYLLLVFLAGIVVSLAINSDIETWMAGLSGKRVDFGYTNAQHTAFYLGLLLITGISWLCRCLRCHVRGVEWGLAIALTALGSIGVIATQTRAIWLALAMIMFGLMIVGSFHLLKKMQRGWLRPKLIFLVSALVFAITFTLNTMKPVIENRLLSEHHVIEAIGKGDLDNIPLSSIGIRIHTWVYGWNKVQERPLTGWGAKSRNSLIDEGPFPDNIKLRFGHFHNSYLETLLAYGILGFTALVILIFTILKGTSILLCRTHQYWGIGLIVSWVFFFIINFFESYIIFKSGMYFFIIVGGVGMSFYLFQSPIRKKQKNE